MLELYWDFDLEIKAFSLLGGYSFNFDGNKVFDFN